MQSYIFRTHRRRAVSRRGGVRVAHRSSRRVAPPLRRCHAARLPRPQAPRRLSVRALPPPLPTPRPPFLGKLQEMEGVHDEDDIAVVGDFDPDEPAVAGMWEMAQAVVQG